MDEFFTALFIVLTVLLLLIASPFVVEHVMENWYAPEYPHSGFSPECPTWTEPETENTLPPTYSYNEQ